MVAGDGSACLGSDNENYLSVWPGEDQITVITSRIDADPLAIDSAEATTRWFSGSILRYNKFVLDGAAVPLGGTGYC
jgi:hypothetical protein